MWHTIFFFFSVHNKIKYVLHLQERVQQLENQLKETEREKERELNALRVEKRQLIQTSHMVRADDALLCCSGCSCGDIWRSQERYILISCILWVMRWINLAVITKLVMVKVQCIKSYWNHIELICNSRIIRYLLFKYKFIIRQQFCCVM